MRSLDFGLFNF